MFGGFMSFFASLGFAIIFNTPKKHLFFAGLVGMIGGLTYNFNLLYHTKNYVPLFVASIVISVFCIIFSYVLKTPTTTFLTSAIIPLVPGGAIYNTMLAIIKGQSNDAIYLLIDTLVQASSIVIAIILISSLHNIFKRIRRMHYGI